MKAKHLIAFFLLAGCAGTMRDCSSCTAENFGADWIVVQYAASGQINNCWSLRNVGITNEPSSDGIFWRSPAGHLVHIGGWYARVQVVNNDFEGAAKLLGVEYSHCKDGKYIESVIKVPSMIIEGEVKIEEEHI